jgi:hypothetical protein
VLWRSHCLPHRRRLKAFDLDASVFGISSAKWPYITRALRFLSDVGIMRRLQQWALYELEEGGFKHDCKGTPVVYNAKTADALENEIDSSDDEVTGVEAGDDTEDEDAGRLKKDKKKRKKTESAKNKAHRKRMVRTHQLLMLTMDPSFHVRVQAAYIMTKGLREVNVKLQTEKMSRDVLGALASVQTQAEEYLVYEKRIETFANTRKVCKRAG